MALIFRTFWKSSSVQICRGFHVSQLSRKNEYEQFMFKLNGYYKYGLLHDDLLNENLPEVVEAVRRLPEEEQMERIHRCIRATQADLNHYILPKEEWTKFEDNHFYLQPYIEEILKEKQEREEWEANH